MKNRKPNTYEDDFKKTSAQFAFESEKSVKQVAEDLGLSVSTLHGWVNKYYPSALIKTNTNKNPAELELAQLKKDFSIVKQERDILKKASAYFASQMR